jgi:hypothetical protein
MNYFEEKEIKDFNKKIRDTFNFLTIAGKYNVIGSASLKKIKYVSDYDIDDVVDKENDSERIRTNIYKSFKSKFEEGKKDPTIFITDFKCGEDEKGESLKWTSQTIKTGINNGIRFQDALIQKAKIKLDIIKLINGVYTDFNETYFLKLGDESNYLEEDASKENILKSISESAQEYKEAGDYFKVIKRSFAYKIKDKTKYKNQLIRMLDFFNSDTGLLYKSRGDFEILIKVLENKFRKPKIEDIKTNLKIIYHNISGLVSPKINECFEKLFELNTKKQLITHITKIISNINILVNKQTIKFLKIKKNRNLII